MQVEATVPRGIRKVDEGLPSVGDWAGQEPFKSVRFDGRKAAELLSLIAGGASIKSACEQLGMARMTVQIWAMKDRSFKSGLARAEEVRFLALADDMVAFCQGEGGHFVSFIKQTGGRRRRTTDEQHGDIAWVRTRLKVAQWFVEHRLPAIYGKMAEVLPDAAPPPTAPQWLKQCSPQTQMRVAEVLARAKAEGESRIPVERDGDFDRNGDPD